MQVAGDTVYLARMVPPELAIVSSPTAPLTLVEDTAELAQCSTAIRAR